VASFFFFFCGFFFFATGIFVELFRSLEIVFLEGFLETVEATTFEAELLVCDATEEAAARTMVLSTRIAFL
jgi:hypothetical protein